MTDASAAYNNSRTNPAFTTYHDLCNTLQLHYHTPLCSYVLISNRKEQFLKMACVYMFYNTLLAI